MSLVSLLEQLEAQRDDAHLRLTCIVDHIRRTELALDLRGAEANLARLEREVMELREVVGARPPQATTSSQEVVSIPAVEPAAARPARDTSARRELLAYLSEYPGATIAQVARGMGKNKDAVAQLVRRLRHAGDVVDVGSVPGFKTRKFMVSTTEAAS